MTTGYDLELLTDAEHTTLTKTTDNGFIERFEEWARLKTDAPTYTLKAAALVALSLAAGDTTVIRPFFGEPIYLNLFTIVVGPSTTMRKTTVLNMVANLIPRNQMTGEDILVRLDDVSIQAFNKALAEAGTNRCPVLFSVDEVAALFNMTKKRDSYMSGFDKELLKAYDHGPINIRRTNATITQPTGAFVTMFAATTPEPLMEVLGREDVETGLLPRLLVFDARDAVRGNRRSLMDRLEDHDKWEAQTDELRDWLYGIAEPRAKGVPNGTDRHGNVTYPVRMLDLAPDALERLDKVEERFHGEAGTDTTALGAIKGRAFWYMAKLSGLFALSRAGGSARIEMRDVLRALWLVETTVADLGRMAEEVGTNAFERRVNEVIHLLEESRQGRVRESVIARALKLTVRERNELLGTLVVRELVRVEKDAAGGSSWVLASIST